MNSTSSSRSSSPSEERAILRSWKPEPLIPRADLEHNKRILNPNIISSKAGKLIKVNNVECLNFGTHNYLGLADHPGIEEAAKEAARKYGVGSCGPRAFYGTMDVHLKLEEELAKFLNVQETVLYSFGFSTIASAIPAYAKAGDLIFVDECCNFAIQQGLLAARSRIIKFEHNNIKQLETLVEEILKEKRNADKRRFIIIEGIYAKTGALAPLNEIIEIKKKHKIRLFIDESRSFGVLGNEGKGITQHFGVDVDEVDLIMASLDNSLCSYGGFCAGSSYVIDHQRLSGSGYCFSASLPPLQTQVALKALSIISKEPEIVRNSQELFKYAHEKLVNLSRLENISHPLSPIKLLTMKNSDLDFRKQDELLSEMCDSIMKEERIAISSSKHLEDEEMKAPSASIRLIISGCLNREEIDKVVKVLESYSAMLD